MTLSVSQSLVVGGFGVGVDPPVKANVKVDIKSPKAVKMLVIVITCSRNSVRIRSASVVS